MSIAALISGRGSNLRAILQSPVGAQVRVVVSDNAEAPGLAIARGFGVPALVCAAAGGQAAFEAELTRLMAPRRPRLIALAGFMRVLSADFIAAHGGRIVNIHPSLLPAYRGLRTHRRALADGAREHGCTVHWVDSTLDGGRIIAANKLTVRADDDEHSLAARVLQLEHALYPRALARLLDAADADVADGAQTFYPHPNGRI